MSDKEKQPEFTVTDRRKFTAEGERRDTAAEPRPQEPVAKPATPPPEPPQPKVTEVPLQAAPPTQEAPPPPTAAEQQAQKQAYHESTKEIDSQVRQLGGRRPEEFQINFERFVASLYMSALMQLGLLREENVQPRIDIIGARQTIDTIELLAEKTTGNLTAAEEGFLQNCLYELHMAYVDITNSIARPAQPPNEAAGKR